MKILSFGLTEGSGWWRVRMPLGVLAQHGHEVRVSSNAVNEEELAWADVVILKNVVDQWGIATAQAMRESKGLKIVMDLDDDLKVGEDHPLKNVYDIDDTQFTQMRTAKIVDAITCTTEYLADKARKLNKNVFVIPNYYEPNYFNVKNRTHDGPVRIGWAGGGTHLNDLEMVAPVVRRILEKYPGKVEFVARGDTRIKKIWGPETECYPVTSIEYWPEAMGSMALDIGICPLADNEFNRCKSHIKAMEYGLIGVPAVCSPTVYGNYPILTIARTEDEWVDALSNLIEKPGLRKLKGEIQRSFWHDNFNLEHHWKEWEEALCK